MKYLQSHIQTLATMMFVVLAAACPAPEVGEVLDRDWEAICGDACAGPPVDVDVGDGTSCVRYEGGAVLCWGIRRGVNDHYRDIGVEWAALAPGEPRPQIMIVGEFFGPEFSDRNTDFSDPRSEEEKRGILDAVDMSIDRDTGCVVRRNGTLWCWGRNERGELAQGAEGRAASKWPVHAAGEPGQDIHGLVSVEVGSTVCALRDDRASVIAQYRLWVDETRSYEACVPGPESRCTIHDGHLWCRGSNFWGLLGAGHRRRIQGDVQVINVEDPVQVSIATTHVCALTRDGDVWCWGDNFFGAVGREPVLDGEDRRTVEPIPERVEGAEQIVQIETATFYSCALRENGQLLCWGNDKSGILGTGSDTGRVPHPQEIPEASNIIDMSLAANHGCILRETGEVACWGSNLYGALGPEQAYVPYGTFQTVRGLPHHGDWPSSD